jgi:5-methylcytosine-specific restriction endonuclease McrA
MGVTAARAQREQQRVWRAWLFARDAHTCAYCRQVFPPASLTEDHIVPRKHGAGVDNSVTACRSCNSRKGGRRPDQVAGWYCGHPVVRRRLAMLGIRVPPDGYVLPAEKAG